MENQFEKINNRLDRLGNLLTQIAHSLKNQNVNTTDSQWTSLKALCDYLPAKPSPATAYGWVHSRTIPCYKGAKRLSFLKSEIDQ